MLLTSSWILDLLTFSVVTTVLVYLYFTRHFNYWNKRGIYCPKPIPFFGNFYEPFAFKTTVQEHLKTFYDSTDDPFFGLYICDEPVLVLKSPGLIKDVLVKDFSVFRDRRIATPKHSDMAYSVFFLKYNIWKQVRSTLSPLFRSSVLKNNYAHLDTIKNLLDGFLRKKAGVIDARSIGGNFACELLARCFFGINSHCFDDSGSAFMYHNRKIFDYNFRNAIVQNLFFIKPSWTSFFRLNFIGAKEINFFKSIFTAALSAKNSYDGNVQNLTDLGNKGVKELALQYKESMTLDIAVSNSIFFLIAGQETSTTILSFTLYELAINQKIQDTLREEIKRNFQKYGEFTREGVKDNKYLEMCLNETMRKYPALPFLDRTPISDYKFRGTDFVVEKGTTVIIPFYALHRDEKYYEHSDKYDPERFRHNNINGNGLNFIPFGEGPRACMGKRLALMALAVVISGLLMKFKFEKCENTPEKIEFDPKNFALISKYGLPLKVSPLD